MITGSRVRVSGEGEQGIGGAESGHLYLRVRLAPHPVFELKDRDLHVRVAVPVTTAVLGGEADVQTLSGKPARLRIPPMTQNGQVFRLKGYGMGVVSLASSRLPMQSTGVEGARAKRQHDAQHAAAAGAAG